MTADPSPLVEAWRNDAERFRAYGADTLATTCEKHAGDLEAWWREWRLTRLKLREAADEAGVAYDTAQRRVARGEWRNVGRQGAPRVRRCDVLPALDPPTPDEPDDVVAALARP